LRLRETAKRESADQNRRGSENELVHVCVPGIAAASRSGRQILVKHAGWSKSPQPLRESSSSHNRAEHAPIGDKRQCSYRAGLDQSDWDFAVASFLKSLSSLFGGKRESDGEPAPKGDGEEYNGFTVRPAPYKEGGQYQTCGYVEKEIGGELKSHKFIRADRFASLDDAVQFSLTKGKQLIDEQGEGLFR